jgi:hypothetical protein
MLIADPEQTLAAESEVEPGPHNPGGQRLAVEAPLAELDVFPHSPQRQFLETSLEALQALLRSQDHFGLTGGSENVLTAIGGTWVTPPLAARLMEDADKALVLLAVSRSGGGAARR